MFAGGLARYLRREYLRRCYENIGSFSHDKSSAELESIIEKYKSKSVICRFFDEFSDDRGDYEAAKAVKNMRILGIDEFPLKKEETTVYSFIGTLDDLECKAKKLIKEGKNK